ncbi:MAG TPA: AI-2E family transporter [Trebonia sp.]|nr:AI-2E family transporter [Trebonia sp.]
MVWRGAGSWLAGWSAKACPAPDATDLEAGAPPGQLAQEASPPDTGTVSPGALSAAFLGDAADVPRWIRIAAAWAWRLLLLAVVLYVLARLAALLYIVVVPCAASLLLTALLHPLYARLRRRGLPPLAATWCTLLLALVLLAGVTAVATARIEEQYRDLIGQLRHTAAQLQNWLASSPFHVKAGNISKASGDIVKYLGQHQSLVEGTVLTGSRIAAETLGGVVLAIFVTFFLIKDGRRIWLWLIRLMRPANRERVDRAGQLAWLTVEYYMRGTVAIAAIQMVVMGVTLTVLNAPLAVPIALLLFLAAFVPLVGVLVAGTLAVLVTLAAKGLIDAIIVLCVLVVMNQLEGHLLQPQIVGKMVRLHPLAVILVLAVGAVVAGIAGAVVAVPLTAVISRFIAEFRQEPPLAAELPEQPPPQKGPDSEPT